MSAGKQKLRLVQLAADGALTVGEFALTLAEQIPFAVQAEVREEDTFLVLSADSRLDAGRDHPLRVMTSAFTFEPVEPGTVLVRQGEPLELLAVIHDLDQRPSTCDEWVQRALSGQSRAHSPKLTRTRSSRSISAGASSPSAPASSRQASYARLRAALSSSRAAMSAR